MKPFRALGVLTLALAAPHLSAQTVKVGGDVQFWYTQLADNKLRLNSSVTPGNSAGYYNLRSEFKENTATIRRAEIKFSGTVVEGVEYEVMLDPSISVGTTNPVILQDAFIALKLLPGMEMKVGQFKNLQTYEGLTSSTEILFAERSQLGRMFGDKRDRGLALSQTFGAPGSFAGKATLAVFNGMNDAISGKGNDVNAQKDFVGRLEFAMGKTQKFGVYTLQGSTDQVDKTGISTAPVPLPYWPTQADVYGNKDKTTNSGAFYAYQDGTWTFTTEYMTGLLGRRFPTLGTAIKREHLEQKFAGYYATGGYTTGKNTILLRYDLMNFNSGNQWYTPYNPYTQTAPGTAILANGAAVDYAPKYTEMTLGYTYAWNPKAVKAANLKLNYIARSKNFLKPFTGQTGEQGGNTLVAALLVSF